MSHHQSLPKKPKTLSNNDQIFTIHQYHPRKSPFVCQDLSKGLSFNELDFAGRVVFFARVCVVRVYLKLLRYELSL